MQEMQVCSCPPHGQDTFYEQRSYTLFRGYYWLLNTKRPIYTFALEALLSDSPYEKPTIHAPRIINNFMEGLEKVILCRSIEMVFVESVGRVIVVSCSLLINLRFYRRYID
jgi:hypothetical protein